MVTAVVPWKKTTELPAGVTGEAGVNAPHTAGSHSGLRAELMDRRLGQSALNNGKL
jgi:hypothetical protein